MEFEGGIFVISKRLVRLLLPCTACRRWRSPRSCEKKRNLFLPLCLELSKFSFTFLSQREPSCGKTFCQRQAVLKTLFGLCAFDAPADQAVEDFITSSRISHCILLRWELMTILKSWPRIKQDYALNLSILLRAGKENNSYSPSNGEWSGKNSNLKSGVSLGARIVVFGLALAVALVTGRKFFVTGHQRGWESRMQPHWRHNTHLSFYESVWLGLHTKVGGSSLLKLNITQRPIANKYCEGKVKRTLKRELKVLEIVKREANKMGVANFMVAVWLNWLNTFFSNTYRFIYFFFFFY